MSAATIGPYTLEDVRYDSVSDVLYLGNHWAHGEDAPDGSITWFYADEEGYEDVVGAVLLSPRRTLERHGRLDLMLPPGGPVVDGSRLREFLTREYELPQYR